MHAVFGRKPSKSSARIPSGIRRIALALALSSSASFALAAKPGPLVPPKADILSVELRHRPMQTVSYFGAGIRPPHQTAAPAAEAESVSVEWFAHSPGIPPGVLVMLETVSDRIPTVKNRIYRMPAKSEGAQSHLFDIPEDETLAAGAVTDWRARIVWRGRVLASRTSPGWETARRNSP